MGADAQIRRAYQQLAASYYKRRAAVAGVENVARLGGVPFSAVAGADMPGRLEVADSVAARLFAAARALEQGSAVLVRWRGDYAIVPRIALEPYRQAARVLGDDEDQELGAWPVWLVAGAIVAGLIAIALVSYTILEVMTASAQNEAAARDLHGRAARWIADRCIADPARCGEYADALNRGLASFAGEGGTYGATPWTDRAVGAGLGIGAALLAVGAFALSGRGSSSRSRRR